MSAELCVHDLAPASCAVCNGAEKRAVAEERAAAERRERGPWFEARYDGACSGCDIEITAGDDIRSDGDGGWLCGGCGDEP